jgi:hypothetical protein
MCKDCKIGCGLYKTIGFCFIRIKLISLNRPDILEKCPCLNCIVRPVCTNHCDERELFQDSYKYAQPGPIK